MASIAELIDFLMSLMRDDNTRQRFQRDPDAVLADKGLENVTGQDVRDARLMMADSGSCQPRSGRQEQGSAQHSRAEHDAIREIQHTTNNFVVGDVTTTVITVNDNDTVVVDSFNTDVTAIQDNDTTDVDVIDIEDNDTVAGDEDSGTEEGAAPEGGLGEPSGAGEGAAPDDGTASGGELPGDDADDDVPFGAAAGEVPPADDGIVSIDSEEIDSGAGEGFAPEHDSGFGVEPSLGTEAGLTPDEPLDDELVG